MTISNQLLGQSSPRLQTTTFTNYPSKGDEVKEFARAIGIPLLPWQEHAVDELCRVKENGNWAAPTGVVLVARQSGKTHLMRMRMLAGLFLWDEKLQVNMAQNRDIALETFRALCEIIDGFSWLRKEVKSITRANGREEIALKNGCRMKVLAPTAGSSRGLSVTTCYIDEIRQMKTFDAFAAVAYTLNAQPNPQMLCFSNAGDAQSVVLNSLRNRAMKVIEQGATDDITWLEWSASPHRKLNDPQGWAEANPALGYTIKPENLAARMGDDPGIIQTELLCRWVETLSSPWPHGAFNGCTALDLELKPDRPTFMGFELAPDRTSWALAGAQILDDGNIGIGVMDFQDSDEPWDDLKIADRIAHWVRKYEPVTILGNKFSSDSVVAKLNQAGIRAETIQGAKYFQACDEMLGSLAGNRISHANQEILTASMNACVKKTTESGGWYVQRKKPAVAAIASILALHKAIELGQSQEVDIAIV